MIALIQRVTEASVTVNQQQIASIGTGLLALIGVQQTDSAQVAKQLAEKMMTYRVFSDDAGKMNLDVQQAGGAVLLVPQFTLVADTSRGRRPGFSAGAAPEQGRELFEELVNSVSTYAAPVGQGEFGADMQVALVNDGPVTFWLQVG